MVNVVQSTVENLLSCNLKFAQFRFKSIFVAQKLFGLKNILRLSFFLSLVFFSSCASKEDILYLQDLEGTHISEIETPVSSIVYQPDDILAITVSGIWAEDASPYNVDESIGYLIDENGNIQFPSIGTIKIAGLTRIEAQNKIKELVSVYLKNPIVNIQLTNFTITILGEVNNPTNFLINQERITILEALGLAGDLAISGIRNDIMIVREVNNVTTFGELDVTSKEIFKSPYYYLKQNDVIYVKPNNRRVQESANNSFTSAILPYVAVILGIVTLMTRI